MDEFCIEHPSNVDRCARHDRLVRVDEASPRFNESKYSPLCRLDHEMSSSTLVSELFRKGWQHPEKPSPHLYAIYKIISPEDDIAPFLTYQ